MKPNQNVTPSSQVDALLPQYVVENYSRFVEFMETATQSEERVGFGQDILQNLQKYRNLDTYKNKIVKEGYLSKSISADADELTLVDGYGFPEENGVLLIGDEIILYSDKDEDGVCTGLQRGAAGTVVLPTFRSTGEYHKTTAEAHLGGSTVTNISVLFLVAMLDNIHESFMPQLTPSRVDARVNHSSLLQNIRDFYSSKGSKLGIKTLFKTVFGEEDIEVSYPGDRMVNPSTSSWAVNTILRAVPWSQYLSDPNEPYTTPDKLIGSELLLKSFPDGSIISRAQCEYVSTYPFGSEIQYDISTNTDADFGNFILTNTTLTRPLEIEGVNNNEFDVYTVTVNSTSGFPEQGIIFVGTEGIAYTSKTQNQFLGCTRGYVSVITSHQRGDKVYGAYYLEGKYTDENGTTYVSRSWPTGVVAGVNVQNPGLLNQIEDDVVMRDAGKIDLRDPALGTFIVNETFGLASQNEAPPTIPYMGDRVWGISKVLYDDQQIYVSSTNTPERAIGPFSTDGSVGPDMEIVSTLHAVPRREAIRDNLLGTTTKGVGTIGVAVDGVPFISNISEDTHYSGEITSIIIENGGRSYVNPTVVFSPAGATGTATVSNGVITGITIDSNANYTQIPTVTVTGGLGGEIALTFDNYGRITGATITNPGQFYNDAPKISITDGSGRGRGALVTCTVSSGSIDTVTVEVAGIDYNAATTQADVISVGEGAVITATVQSWQYDRKYQVDNTPNATYDQNSGFLFEKSDSSLKSRYGYIAHPQQLLEDLGQVSNAHSPIIGWAWDGNPIYGPYGYANNVDDTDGYEKQLGGYVLDSTRALTIPHNSETVATLPPDTATYPMGTFIQDWRYDKEEVLGLSGAITTENSDAILTEGSININYDTANDLTSVTSVLDELNGKVCNTPEFPADIYPDGVYCYFVSTFGDAPKFPYIIGSTFKNLPSTQNIKAINEQGQLSQVDNMGGTYTTDEAEIYLANLDLHRIGGIGNINTSISVDVNGISEGSVSEIYIEDAGSDQNVAGDFLYFDNTETDGQGASANITHIYGETITDTEIIDIKTSTISHRQLIRLGDVSDVYVLNEGQRYPTSSGASFEVISYDTEFQLLEIQTTTKNLVQPGDTFRDSRGTLITIPNSIYGVTEISSDVVGGTSTFMSYSQPESDTAAPGDLWWSASNNRLYVLYKDTDTTQWVTTNPIGMRPYTGALDVPVGDTTATGGQVYASPQSDNRVTISTQAPNSRSDGSLNQAGDLWWSTHTGNLYIWNDDRKLSVDNGQEEWSAEWVVTDPAAVTSGDGASSEFQYAVGSAIGTVYEQQARVLISESAPTTDNEGNALSEGLLWWSPLTGKMYIYYTDSDTSQWVVTNPSGSIGGGEGSLNTVVPGTGGVGDSVSFLPELPTTSIVWVEDTKHFKVGDTVTVVSGAPGVEGMEETNTVSGISSEYIVLAGRNTNSILIENGSNVINKSRSLFQVTTSAPHNIVAGDNIRIENSTQTNLNNKEFDVVIGGIVTAPTATSTISSGEVTDVTLTTFGSGFSNLTNVNVTFVGGGGIGASGYATVSNQGTLDAVYITNGGQNYTSAPTPVFNTPSLDTEFSFYVSPSTQPENTIIYGTTAANATGSIMYLKLHTGGAGYVKLPKITGVYKRIIDRASTRINLEGTTIGSIDVLRGGRRYNNPTVVIEDTTGNGSGATATASVISGSVVSITVTNPGSGYTEPIVTLIETDAKFIALTDTIGKIKSFNVDRPGRNLANDPAVSPEVELQARLIVSPTSISIGSFQPNNVVYQGTNENRLATGVVVNYDPDRQMLTLKLIEGIFKKNEIVYNEFGTEATVLLSGQAVARLEIGGIAPSVGRFIGDESKLSESYAVVQDSLKYQWFSYEISSSLQQIQYDTFVRELVHPTGFAMFSNVLISDSTQPPLEVYEADVTLE